MTDAQWVLMGLMPVIIALLGIITSQQLERIQLRKQHKEELDNAQVRVGVERETWRSERQQLLDRIQAGSFAEYKQAEVKIIKAQNGEKEPPKLEQL